MTETWLVEARKELGVHETPGSDSNPEIVKFFQEAGHPEVKTEDEAWCAAFVGAMLHRAGIKPSGSLMARSYLKWGDALQEPKEGCIVVLWRGSPEASTGHVGFLVAHNAETVSMLGGNQGSAGAVSVENFPHSRVLGYRWPHIVTVKKEKPMNPLSIIGTILNVIVPTIGATKAPVTSAGTTVSPVTTITNAIGMIIGALLAKNGVDGGTATTIGGGVAVFIAALLNQLHITGGANVNTVIGGTKTNDS